VSFGKHGERSVEEEPFLPFVLVVGTRGKRHKGTLRKALSDQLVSQNNQVTWKRDLYLPGSIQIDD